MNYVHVPRESVNDQSVMIQKVLVATGSIVDADQVIVEIETSKTTIEITAPEAGVIQHALMEGQEVEVGSLLFAVGEAGSATPADPATALAPSSMSTAVQGAFECAPVSVAEPAPVMQLDQGQPPLLSKAAQRAAERLMTSLEVFAGRWVTRADIERGCPAESTVEARREKPAQPPAAPVAASAPAAPLPDMKWTVKPLSMRKRAEVENLLKGSHAETASTIGIGISLPGARIVEPSFLFRNSISDLVIFEGARLLRQYPELNAFHLDDKHSGQYDAVNFGVSFDNVANLKVLTLHNANTITLPGLHTRFSELLDLFESNKPIPAELLGTSTVTLSDLSSTSASFMLPLINGHQSLILGVVRHDAHQFEIFASFDHRVTEGLRVIRFLEALRDRVLSHYRDGKGHARLVCYFCSRSMQDELRHGQRGMLNMTLPSGETAVLCRNCFEGL